MEIKSAIVVPEITVEGQILAPAYTLSDGTQVISHAGDPNGLITAQKGSLCMDTTNSTVWVNSDGVTAWSKQQSVYSSITPTPVTIGGIAAGSTFTNQTMQQMFDTLLYPYQAPSFTSFSFAGVSSPLEVGASIAANRTAIWSTSNSANVAVNSISVLDITSSATIASGLSNSGSTNLTYAAVTHTTATSHNFRISATNSQSGAFTRDFGVSWSWRLFYGESASGGPLIEADIHALRVSGLQSSFAGTYSFAAGGYKYWAFPASMGNISVAKDISTNLAVPLLAVYDVTVTNSFGVATSYHVYRTLNSLGGAITIQIS